MTAVVWLTIVPMTEWSDDTQGRALQIVGRSFRLTAVHDRKSERYSIVVPTELVKQMEPVEQSWCETKKWFWLDRRGILSI